MGKKSKQSKRGLRIEQLRLGNFKGVQIFRLDALGADVDVFGDNGTGKTTLADAWAWLLWGKDSAGRADFGIKTLNDSGEALHNLHHEVGADLTAGGQDLSLHKVYTEKWTKRRGASKKEFTGHTTEHFIDGVPVAQSEYQQKIAELADEQTFRLLTDPGFFSDGLHWQDRRQLLLEVCGDVTDEEVIASSDELADLPEILGDRSQEDHRKVITSRRAQINKELQRIPVRIDEVHKSKPDAQDASPKELESKLGKLRAERSELDEQRARINAGGEVAEQRKRIAEIDARLAEIKTEQKARIQKKVDALEQRAREFLGIADDIQRKIGLWRREILDYESKIERFQSIVETLRSQYADETERQMSYSGETSCPACGRELPEEQLQAARENAVAEFNESKAKTLKGITTQAEIHKQEISIIKQNIRELTRNIDENEPVRAEYKKKFEALLEEAQKIKAEAESDLDAFKESDKLSERREQAASIIEALTEHNGEDLSKLSEQTSKIDEEIATLQSQIALIQQREAADKRIKELCEQEEKLAKEFEELERQLYMLDQFVQAKVRLLDERINSHFGLARFQMFKVLVNGGLEECCETMAAGVPYRDLNHGSKVRVGLDIISTLQDHFQFAPPVFIDQCESVTRLPEMSCQIIRLVVSEADAKLRVETKELAAKSA